MRDVIFTLLMLGAMGYALRKPWVGALLWVWMGLMNPHRYTFGFAFNLPWSMMVAGVTLIGLLRTRERQWPFRESWAPGLVLLFTVWITLSWLNGRFVNDDFPMWSRALKTFVMLLVMMSLVYTRERIQALVWVVALSIGVLGAKGGAFTVATGGSYRVWGPADSWVFDNNAFAVALIMVVPLLRYLQTQLPQQRQRWYRRALGLAAVLCAAAALGSQSRGGFLALCAMGLLLWWRGRNRFLGAAAMVLVVAWLLLLMPESWFDRMRTIQSYDDDVSALGRLAAWKVAIGLAGDHLTGAGFTTGLSEYFYRYLGIQREGIVAHSIYFEVLGQHGYPGLLIFLAIGISTWRAASRVRKEARDIPEAQWCVSLVSLCQVSLLGYAVGGAFLTLAFYDLPYYVLAMVVLTRQWVARRGWETDVLLPSQWTAQLQSGQVMSGAMPAKR